MNSLNGAKLKLLFLVVCGLLILSWFRFLPERYYYDHDFIMILKDEVESFIIGSSYISTAFFFKYFTLILACIVLVVTIKIIFRISAYRFPEYLISSILLCLSVIMFFRESKDIIVFAIVGMAIYLIPRHNIVFLCLVFVLYSLFFRSYYFLIIMVAFIYYIFFNGDRKLNISILSILVLVVSLSLNNNYVQEMLNHTADVNYGRIGGGASRTAIFVPFPYENVLYLSLNMLYTFMNVTFPFVFHWTFLDAFVTMVFVLLIIMLVKLYKLLISYKELRLYFSFLLSFVTVSCMFEPDTGSYLRHFLSISPLIIYLLYPSFEIDK